MTDDELQTDRAVQDYSQKYLDGTETLDKSSPTAENFYRIKAIENGGLPIEIININADRKYCPIFVYNNGLEENLIMGEEYDEMTEDMFADLSNADILYYTVNNIIDYNIYYETVFGKTYKGVIKQNRMNVLYDDYIRYGQSQRKFLDSLKYAADSSRNITSVDQISSVHSVSAQLKPDENLRDGEIVLDDVSITFDTCEEIETIQDKTDVDSFIRSLFNEKRQYYDATDFDGGWVWSSISDVRENKSENQVILTVETPFGMAIFPYELTHDTDSSFWKLVEYSDGLLTSLRGKDVCIRPRSEFPYIFQSNNLQNAPHSEAPSFDINMPNQPLEFDPTVIEDPTEVVSVGVDTEYVWTLGFPDKTGNPPNEQTDDSIFDKMRELF